MTDPTGHCPPISSCLDKAQDVADYVGLIPKIGDAVDAVNAGVSLIRGDYEAAGRRAIAVIPIIGTPIAMAMKANKLAKVVKVLNKTDDVNDARRVTKKVTPEKAKNLLDAEKKSIPKSQLGPSGKPKVNVVKHATNKRAKDAVSIRKNGTPARDVNPRKGGSHYHSTNSDGSRKKGNKNVHHEFPLKRGKLPD